MMSDFYSPLSAGDSTLSDFHSSFRGKHSTLSDFETVLSQKSLIVVSIESLVGTSLVWLRTKKVRALQGSARTWVL